MVSWLTVWMLPYLSSTSTLQKSTILIFVQMKALTQYNAKQYNHKYNKSPTPWVQRIDVIFERKTSLVIWKQLMDEAYRI